MARPAMRGRVTGIGDGQAEFTLEAGDGETPPPDLLDAPDHATALAHVLEAVRKKEDLGALAAVGHRVVQGGPHHDRAQLITPDLLEELRRLCPQDPPHLPAAIAGIEAAQKLGPEIRQVACFDTAFHRTMPQVAQLLPLPAALTGPLEMNRFGFHGLSCQYIMGELERIAGREAAHARVVVAHLGNGASMTAVREGRSVETTMGFTPAGGLVMGSRTGDIDPGALIYLLQQGKVAVEGLNDLVYRKSGLKGVSGWSSDMRKLLEARTTDPRAAQAVDLFSHAARKALGALVAVLDGLDTLVFTGGLGEHSPLPRAQICEGFGHLGLKLEAKANEAHAPVISTPDSRVVVRVIPTDEELVIARETAALCLPSP